MSDLISSSKSYRDLLVRLKNQIRTAQVRAAVAVNQELVSLYWGIGQEILTRQKEDGWGTRVIERLAKDLRLEFPGMQGLSARNLGYMKAFAEAWPDELILQQLAAKLPWFHNCVLLGVCRDEKTDTDLVRSEILLGGNVDAGFSAGEATRGAYRLIVRYGFGGRLRLFVKFQAA